MFLDVVYARQVDFNSKFLSNILRDLGNEAGNGCILYKVGNLVDYVAHKCRCRFKVHKKIKTLKELYSLILAERTEHSSTFKQPS